VHFTLEELEMALSGRLVTRVIYLEDPQSALPVRDTPDQQRYYEVRSDEDPLKAADRLGRPVAIMRMGSRTPELDSQTQRFLFASPPLLKLDRPTPLPALRSGIEECNRPSQAGSFEVALNTTGRPTNREPLPKDRLRRFLPHDCLSPRCW